MKNFKYLFAFITVLFFYCFSNTFSQVGQKIVPDSLSAHDVFGYSVDISDNYAIVGSPQVSTSLSQAFGNGKAYIYHYNNGLWEEQQILTASDGSFWDWFGCSVSINGEYAAIGAFGDDISGADNGAVYLFHLEGTNWIEVQKIIPSDSAPGDYFGWSVSLGNDRLVVGAPRKSSSLQEVGSVYIFKNNNGVWSEEEKLVPNDVYEWDQFGHSVSINDWQILIGKPQVSSSQLQAYGSGAAYYFTFDGNHWTQAYKLTPDNIGFWDWFGCSVSIKNENPFIGCFAQDITGWDNGTAYLYTDPNNYFQFIPDDSEPGDFLGWSVSSFKNLYVIGAPRSDDYGTRSGSVYLYEENNKSFTQMVKLFDETPSAYEDFGYSVAIRYDYFIVGSPFSNDSGDETGSVTVFKYEDVVPVELVYFNIKRVNKSIHLEWETATENNNRGFFIERNSNNSDKWTSLGFVEGHGTTSLPHKYSFIDYNLSVTGEYVYRLKQLDFDGSSTYSVLKSLNISNMPQKFELKQNFPNPFNFETKIEFSLPKNCFVTIEISDTNGKIVKNLVNKVMDAGRHSVIFNGKGLTSGIYFYRFWAEDFSATKKMILLK